MAHARKILDMIALPLRHCFDVRSRARRSEYWPFALTILFINAFIWGVGLPIYYAKYYAADGLLDEIFIGALLFDCFILVPGTTAAIRRLHDTNRTGLWMLLPMIPLILTITAIAAENYRLLDFIYSNFKGLAGIVFVALLFIMLIGTLLIGVYLVFPSDPQTNRFGRGPNTLL